MESKFLKTFKAARRVSTPLIGIQTPDPAATIQTITVQCTDPNDPTPIVIWDAVRGFWTFPEHETGKAAIAAMAGANPAVLHPVKALSLAEKLPANSILFVMNSQNLFGRVDGFPQAIWNLRDLYKEDSRTLVLLGPSLSLPPELSQDVLILSEPLPTNDELSAIVRQQYHNAKVENDGLPEIGQETISRAVDALSGLAAFPAE